MPRTAPTIPGTNVLQVVSSAVIDNKNTAFVGRCVVVKADLCPGEGDSLIYAYCSRGSIICTDMPRRNRAPIHTPFRDLRVPHTKRKFSNKESAQTAAELGMLQTTGLELSIYKCDQCGGWHLTSRSAKD
jgi:hypothetical protein